ncbi:MAG TPA: AAA family ATPase [Streptosporangiaceae bacterium]|nr:AAA family ATPase [Streptosporangiaceae bacterium]
MSGAGMVPGLTDRRAECEVLGRLVAAVRAGESRALVVHGEPGVGKTALLEYLAGQASGCRVAHAAGIQSEMELAFAVLHQLCAPMLDRLERLPAPQRDALRIAFGLSAGPAPDRFLIGLAALGLLSEMAAERPLVCIVDDEQWLDSASARVLAFVARRLGAESVGLVFGARVPTGDLAGLPELVIGGLREDDARALLDSALTGPLDALVRDQIVAEADGNPLALLELPRGWTAAELAGGFGLPAAVPLAGRIEESFRRQLGALPAQSRRLLQLAAAEPTGDPVLVWRAAGRLGICAEAAGPAVEAGLAEFGVRVRFRHPLVRSAAYRSAPADDLREIHAALAEVTDPASDPDRLTWHRAAATAAPDEGVAAALERSAGRAQARGGLSAAAAFLERAMLLTPDPGRRADRAIAAAEAKHQAGAPDVAAELLVMAEAGPLEELARARISLLRGQMAFSAGNSSDTPRLLIDAARRFEALDTRLARETYLEALSAALLGHRTSQIGTLEIARAARGATAAPPGASRAPDLLLEGMATLITDGYETGVPAVQRALSVFRDGDLPIGEQLRWLFVATRCAIDIWDDESWRDLAIRQVELARAAGALSLLPFAITQRFGMHLHAGEFATAAQLVEEFSVLKEATATGLPDFGTMMLAAWQGRSREAFRLIDEFITDMSERGQGYGVSLPYYTASVLYNGLGRYADAMASAELASEQRDDLAFANLALAELIEAAVRGGQPERAAAAMGRLTDLTLPSGTAWGLGVAARSRALLSEGDEAERLYREAIGHLSSAPARTELARAHLLYGEWLRRQRRRREAREHLRTARGMLEAMGMDAFAERAGRELRATGETARKRTAATAQDEELTAQEAHIARLAREGLSNPEIGSRLFISARTVQYHLGNIFAKLGIASRSQLSHVLP